MAAGGGAPRQADRDEGREDGLTTAEREQLRRLRRENYQFRKERKILREAAAWFARRPGPAGGTGAGPGVGCRARSGAQELLHVPLPAPGESWCSSIIDLLQCWLA